MSSPGNHLSLSLLLFFSLLSLTFSHSLSSENHLLLPSNRKFGQDDQLFCDSWRFSVETNDAGIWDTIPTRCFDFVKNYVTSDRYLSDSEVVAGDELEFAKSVKVSGDGKDAWVFDVDETLLFNLPYYELHGYGSEIFDEESFDEYMLLAKSPALSASLSLYKELQQLGFTIFVLTGRSEPFRNATEANLRDAGYSNWERLILRGPSDKAKLAVEYKDTRNEIRYETWDGNGNGKRYLE